MRISKSQSSDNSVVNKKYILFASRWYAGIESIRDILIHHTEPFDVCVLNDDLSNPAELRQQFVVNSHPDKKTKFTLVILPILYDSLVDAMSAWSHYNFYARHGIYRPYVVELNNINDTNVSLEFFNKLDKNSISKCFRYDEDTGDLTEIGANVKKTPDAQEGDVSEDDAKARSWCAIL